MKANNEYIKQLVQELILCGRISLKMDETKSKLARLTILSSADVSECLNLICILENNIVEYVDILKENNSKDIDIYTELLGVLKDRRLYIKRFM